MHKNRLINKEQKNKIKDNKKNYKVEVKIKENLQKLKLHINKIIKRIYKKVVNNNNNNNK